MLAVGTQLAGYRIDGVVGRGGMGVVYRATEIALARPVALKLVAPELAGDARFRERFLNESRIAASIDHAGILPVYAAGEADGELYLATRFVAGTDLRGLLDEGTIAPARALGLAGQVGDALDAAHARGLVHRDVKPGNVLVDGADHCYLCDFGLTQQLGSGGTSTAGLAGSLDYLAPEQIRGGEVDGRADQYALACLLYELLSGAPPFRRATEAQTLWAHLQEGHETLVGHGELDPVLSRALATDPEERYETCTAFVDDARRALGLGLSPVVLGRRRRMGRLLLATGAALLVVAAAGVLIALVLGSRTTIDVAPDSVGALDPDSLRVTSATTVGNAPTEIAASEEWVWVVNSNDGTGTISRLDAETSEVRSTFSVAGTPRNVLAAFGSLWVGTTEGRVYRIEPSTDLVESAWTLPNAGEESAFVVDQGAGWLTAGGNAVWAGSSRAISRIDPETGKIRGFASPAWGPMSYGFGSLWVIGATLDRLSPQTMRRIGRIEVASGFVRIAAGVGAVWVTEEGGNVLRIDPRRTRVSRRYEMGGDPFGVTVGAGAVWVAIGNGQVARIDPGTDAVAVTSIGEAPRGVSVGAGSVWVSVD